MEAQKEKDICIRQGEIYRIGLACILIASKFEDMRHIKLHAIYEDAGHCKFSKEEIMQVERDILTALNFKIKVNDSRLNYPKIFDESNLMFKRIIIDSQVGLEK